MISISNFRILFLIIIILLISVSINSKDFESKKNSSSIKNLSNPKNLSNIENYQEIVRTIAKKALNSVVSIRTDKTLETSSEKGKLKPYLYEKIEEYVSIGSGIILSKKGYIVTNYHVVENSDHIYIQFDEDEKYPAKLIGKDEKFDIAVIKTDVSLETNDIIPFGDSERVEIGDICFAVGNPFGLHNSFSHGIISSKSRKGSTIFPNCTNNNVYIQTDAPINQGNSGGPLINIKGEIIGINTAIFSSSGMSIGIGFAIPINIVKQITESIISLGKVSRSELGLFVSDYQLVKAPEDKHVIVKYVFKNSPAYKAGIKKNDIIYKINDHNIDGEYTFKAVCSNILVDDKLFLSILRNQSKIEFNIQLSSDDITLNPFEVENCDNNIYWFGAELTLCQNRKDTSPFRVSNILEDSSLYKSGLKIGDRIISINSVKTEKAEDLNNSINKFQTEKASVIHIQRGSENVLIPITYEK